MDHGERSRTATDRAVPIGDRLYWVGQELPGDQFQCHAYLLENGRDSVLFDPGSMLTFEHMVRAVESVIPFSSVRWFVCHHPDPDITASLPAIDRMITRPDAVVVTHWRASMLMRHLGLRLPFWEVDKHDWKLELEGGRTIEFVLTPYVHFPGAFVSFDRATGTLLSSDLFGGIDQAAEGGLYAEDESYFEAMRPFHEHYMPSREHLLSTLVELERLPVRQIAPQHGRIVPSHLVAPLTERLKGLDCGLYLFSPRQAEVDRLMTLTSVLRDSLEALVGYRDFAELVAFLVAQGRRLAPLRSLELWSGPEAGSALRYAAEAGYHGEEATPPPWVAGLFGARQVGAPHLAHVREGDEVAWPLFGADGVARAVAVMRFEPGETLSEDAASVLAKLAGPLAVAVERESMQLRAEEERDRLYERSIRDALTGLYSRRYLDDAARHLLDRHRRDAAASVGLAMIDVDHFKRVNDLHGHPAGDAVLREIAARIRSVTRGGDVVVRYGGEEIAVIAHAANVGELRAYAERVRRVIGGRSVETASGPLAVTVSVGVALHAQDETLESLVRRADAALYQAKRRGRDRVEVAR